MTRMLTAALVLCGSMALGAQDDWFVNSPRPMAAMAEKIERQTGSAITYEDPSYQYAADIEVEADPPSGKPYVGMRALPFAFTFDAEKRKDAVKAVRELVEHFEMRTGGQKFRVITENGYIHLVPQLNRDKQGAWAEQRPMLDTRISLAAGKRTLVDFLTEFTQVVTKESGREMYLGTMPLNLMFNTHIVLPAFKNSHARDVLREALSQAMVKLSWQLFGSVGGENQALNVHVTGTRDGDH